MLIKGLPGLQMPAATHKVLSRADSKANALDKWKIIVGDAQKHVDQKQVDFVGNAILTRAMKLGHETPLNGEEVFLFMLRVTQRWALRGEPVQLFISRLPTNLSEVGIMKLAEEAADVAEKMGTKQ